MRIDRDERDQGTNQLQGFKVEDSFTSFSTKLGFISDFSRGGSVRHGSSNTVNTAYGAPPVAVL